MKEVPPKLEKKDSAEQKIVFGSEELVMSVSQFCSDPETFIVNKLDEVSDQESPVQRLAHALKALNTVLDDLFATSQIITHESGRDEIVPPISQLDPDIEIILQSGRDSEAAADGMVRLLKRAGVPKQDVKDFFAQSEVAKTSQEALFQRGMPVRIDLIYGDQ